MIDGKKSVEQLEGRIWTGSNFPTGLVEKCFYFRKIPINDLTIGQLRLMIGQNIGLPFLIPKAIGILKVNILAEGDLYEGDLLSSVLTVTNNFWVENPQLRNEIERIIANGQPKISKDNQRNIHRQLLKKIEVFKIR